MFADIRGTRLYFEVIGEGQPLILLPGGPGGDCNLYKKAHLPLAEHFQLILFDPRGCGQSAASEPEKYHIDEYIEDVEALRQYLGLESFNVLGKSYGGMAALGYVLRYPQVINKLIIVASATGRDFLKLAQQNLHARGTDAQRYWGQKLLAGDLANQDELSQAMEVLGDLYSIREKQLREDDAQHKWNAQIAFDPCVYGFSTFLHDIDFTAQLKSIQQPTLVIGGDQDWVCDPSFSQTMAEKIPNASLCMLAAGHAVDSDQTEKYLAAISDFL
ncbi:MAG: alpha/beta fold hydrolase [Coxiellaceae bacterium]|nr:alpha/beta fold hydrolase [Coxiellaceae bacterium]